MFEVRSLTERAMKEVPQHTPGSENAPEFEIPEAGEPVSAVDVLEMHDFLKDFDGDFERLFRSS